MSTLSVEHPAEPIDLHSVGRKIAESFGFPETDTDDWFQSARPENVTALRAGDALIGGLIRIGQGQFFGGRSVPATGIAGVAVLPEWRRSGAALYLMTEVLRHLRSTGWALSNLFASTHGLYNQVGYGVAGARHEGKIATSAIQVAAEPTLDVRRLTDADRPQQHALYSANACKRSGFIDRGPYVWHRTFRTWRGRPAFSTGVFDGDRMVGYVVWRRAGTEPPANVHIVDVVAPTPPIARRIWAFLHDHGTIAPAITGVTGPTDPFWLTLPHPGPEVTLTQISLLRLVDLPAAIAARGYAPHVKLQVGLEVEDPILNENQGLWTLVVEGGRGKLERGGQAEASVTIEGLASLYSGHLDATGVATRGQLVARADAADRLAGIFAGPAPWMPDYF